MQQAFYFVIDDGSMDGNVATEVLSYETYDVIQPENFYELMIRKRLRLYFSPFEFSITLTTSNSFLSASRSFIQIFWNNFCSLFEKLEVRAVLKLGP